MDKMQMKDMADSIKAYIDEGLWSRAFEEAAELAAMLEAKEWAELEWTVEDIGVHADPPESKSYAREGWTPFLGRGNSLRGAVEDALRNYREYTEDKSNPRPLQGLETEVCMRYAFKRTEGVSDDARHYAIVHVKE